MTRRDLVECEAESAAYVVLSALGIDAGAYSLGYVAGWSKTSLRAKRRVNVAAVHGACLL